MPKRPRFYEAAKSKRRRRKSKTVRRQLFPSAVVGEAFLPGLKTVVKGKKERKSFKQKVADIQTPPFTVMNAGSNSVITSDLNPPTITGSTTSKSGYDGLQHIQQLSMQQNSTDVWEVVRKVRDVYHVSQTAYEQSVVEESANHQWKSGLKLIQKAFSFVTNFINAGSSTAEFEVLVFTPNRLIKGTTSYYSSPLACWREANSKARLAANNTPLADTDWLTVGSTSTTAINTLTIGDRPYKAATKAEFSKWWKICDKKKFVLQPGQQIKYQFARLKKKNIDYDDLYDYDYLPNVNFEMLIIGKGQLVEAGGTVGNLGITNRSFVTTSDFAYGYTYHKTQTFQVVNSQRKVVYKVTELEQQEDITRAQQNFFNPDTRVQMNVAHMT